jgi:hypothetical protein
MLETIRNLRDPDGARSDQINEAAENFSAFPVKEGASFNSIEQAFDTVDQAATYFYNSNEIGHLARSRISRLHRGHDALRAEYAKASTTLDGMDAGAERDVTRALLDQQTYSTLSHRWADISGVVHFDRRDEMHRNSNDLARKMESAEDLWKGLSNASVKRGLDAVVISGGAELLGQTTGWDKGAPRVPGMTPQQMLDRVEDFGLTWHEKRASEANRTGMAQLQEAMTRTDDLAASPERVRRLTVEQESDATKDALGFRRHEHEAARMHALKFGNELVTDDQERSPLKSQMSVYRNAIIKEELARAATPERTSRLQAFSKISQETSADPFSRKSLDLNRTMFHEGILLNGATRQLLRNATAKTERMLRLEQEEVTARTDHILDSKETLSPRDREKQALNTVGLMHEDMLHRHSTGREHTPENKATLNAVRLKLQTNNQHGMSLEGSLNTTKALRKVVGESNHEDRLNLIASERATTLLLEAQRDRTEASKARG